MTNKIIKLGQKQLLITGEEAVSITNALRDFGYTIVWLKDVEFIDATK